MRKKKRAEDGDSHVEQWSQSDANSSHLERLMDRGQHFCTYPDSLLPAVNY